MNPLLSHFSTVFDRFTGQVWMSTQNSFEAGTEQLVKLRDAAERKKYFQKHSRELNFSLTTRIA